MGTLLYKDKSIRRGASPLEEMELQLPRMGVVCDGCSVYRKQRSTIEKRDLLERHVH